MVASPCLTFVIMFFPLSISTGLFLVAYSIIFGIETAKGVRWLYRRSSIKSFFGTSTCLCACNSKNSRCRLTFMIMLILMLALLWGLFGSLLKKNFEDGGSEAQLFLACLIGPLGVWIRWFLARFNGRGIVKWMPVGTLAANVLAASVMAALAMLKKAVRICTNYEHFLQFNLMNV